MKIVFGSSLLALVICAGPAVSEELSLRPVTVTAHMLPTSTQSSAVAVRVIPRKEIVTSGVTQVVELLRRYPELTVASSGGPGRVTQVGLRGSGHQDVLVLIDGMKANDPMNISGSFDFGTLSTSNIERIEILKGSQSSLYGSGAAAGVINIITRAGSAEINSSSKPEADWQGGLGSYGERHVRGTFINPAWGAKIFGSASVEEQDGLSSAAESQGNHERDRFSQNSFQVGVSKAQGAFEIKSAMTSTRTQFDLDRGGGVGADDDNYMGYEQRLMANVQLTRLDRWSLHYSVMNTKRGSDNPDDQGAPAERDSFWARSQEGQAKLFFAPTSAWATTLILDGLTESGRSQASGPYASNFSQQRQQVVGSAAEIVWQPGQFYSALAVRGEESDPFGDTLTYRVSPGYDAVFANFKISCGTGIKYPTLYQTYSAFGNPSLRPERSQSVDVAIEIPLASSHLAVGFFQKSTQDLIDYDFLLQRYQNGGLNRVRGAELSFEQRWDKVVWQQTVIQTQRAMLRHSRLRWHHLLGLHAWERWRFEIEARYRSAYEDLDPQTYAVASMPSLWLWNGSSSYQINSEWQARVMVENILDKEYQEVRGYQSNPLRMSISIRGQI